MSLIPFNPPTSIYHDVTAERLMHGFVVPDLGFAEQTGLDRTIRGIVNGDTNTFGDWVRVVFSDGSGEIATSGRFSPPGWKVLVEPDGAILSGDGTPGARTYGTAELNYDGLFWDYETVTVRAEGCKVPVWVSCYEFDGMGGAAWTSWVKVKPGDGEVGVTLTNGANWTRMYVGAKP